MLDQQIRIIAVVMISLDTWGREGQRSWSYLVLGHLGHPEVPLVVGVMRGLEGHTAELTVT